MRSKVDPEKARESRARAAYEAYAKRRAELGDATNKTWDQLTGTLKAAWKEAADEVTAAVVATLDQEETFMMLLKLAMRDALGDDHICQLVTMFVGRGGIPGKVRIIVAPDRISIPFDAPLQGRHDG